MPTGKPLHRWRIKLGRLKYDIQEIVLDPQGKWLAYANADNSKVLDLRTDARKPLADLGEAGSISLSQDGAELWAASRTGLERFDTRSWARTGQWHLKSEPIATSPVSIRTGQTPAGESTVAVPSAKGLVVYRGPEMTGEFVTADASSGVAFARKSGLYLNLSGTLSFVRPTGEVVCRRSYGGRYDYGVSDDGEWLALSKSSRVDLWRFEELLDGCQIGGHGSEQ